jgi:NUC153 domain
VLRIVYQPIDTLSQALRHSKVKLSWDQDDPERDRVTRRALSHKEIEENDFRAYVASSTDSSSEDETKSRKKLADRDRLRALLLDGGGNDLPEGWAGSKTEDTDGDGGDVDMEVTFRPALTGGNDEDETTLDKYHRKMREKRKKRKQELKDKGKGKPAAVENDFFARSGGEEDSDEESHPAGRKTTGGEQRSKPRKPSTKEELSLLVAPDQPDSEPRHFDMATIIKAEKNDGKKRRGRKKKTNGDDENELQDNFTIDVKDERFRALHEDHAFAIDPSNPR